VVLFAFGSSSVPELLRIGTRGRWIALVGLAAIAVVRVVVRGARLRPLPPAWLAAA